MPRLSIEETLKGGAEANTGIVREGFDMSAFQTSLSENSAATQPAQGDSNIGTGFDPSFESTPDDSLGVSALKTAGNVPKSLFTLGKDVVSAVAHPIETGKALTELVKGTAAKGAEKVLEDTEIGQAMVSKMNDSRVSRGLPELQKDEEGKFQLPQTEEMQVANAVGNYFNERYGSLENAKESFVEDPAGVLADIATVITGGGAALRTAGQSSKIPTLTKAGEAISTAGKALEPTSLVTKAVTAPIKAVAQSTPARIVGETLPSSKGLAQGQVVKALDLTQGDLQKIQQSTGNDVTDFVVRNNLLKDTPEQVAFAADDLKANTMALVRNEVGNVDAVYKASDVPRLQDGMRVILAGVDKIVGLEDEAGEIRRMLQQSEYSLSDVQRAKELIDANSDIYSKFGDIKSSSQSKGLANVRTELRSFIEDEVTKFTGGETNINKLNNDVMTSKAISDAIELRATRGLTRQGITVFDGILGFSAGAAISPEVGLAVFVTKKLSETPSFRIALAKALSVTPVEDINKIAKGITEKTISPEVRASIAKIVDTAKGNKAVIESGSQVIDEASQSNQSTNP